MNHSEIFAARRRQCGHGGPEFPSAQSTERRSAAGTAIVTRPTAARPQIRTAAEIYESRRQDVEAVRRQQARKD